MREKKVKHVHAWARNKGEAGRHLIRGGNVIEYIHRFECHLWSGCEIHDKNQQTGVCATNDTLELTFGSILC